jgi:hypothetical protein
VRLAATLPQAADSMVEAAVVAFTVAEAAAMVAADTGKFEVS